MESAIFSLDSYFERINYKGGTEASEGTLSDIHTAHTLNVPFENWICFIEDRFYWMGHPCIKRLWRKGGEDTALKGTVFFPCPPRNRIRSYESSGESQN